MERFEKAKQFFYQNFSPTSIAHDLKHVERVVRGAEFFAEMLGLGNDKKKIVEIAAYYHDFIRPRHPGINHAKASAEKVGELFSGFGFGEKEINEIKGIIETHSFSGESYREKVKRTIPEECVFLADKLLECSGHYIAFRRAVYVGEAYKEKFGEMEKIEALKYQYRRRFGKISNYRFIKEVQAIREKQLKVEKEFVEALDKGEEWAREIALGGFEIGFKGDKNTDQFIEEFYSESRKGAEFREKALQYIKGDLSNIV